MEKPLPLHPEPQPEWLGFFVGYPSPGGRWCPFCRRTVEVDPGTLQKNLAGRVLACR